MKRVFKVLLVLLVALMPMLAVSAKSAKTTTTTADKSKTPVNFYVFYGAECPHCEDLLKFIAELDKDSNYNYMYKVVKYETWHNSENATLMQKVFNYYGVTDTSQMGVPLFVIGDYHNSGFPNDTSSSQYAKVVTDIKDAIKKAYNDAEYKDVVDGIGKGTIDISDADRDETSTKKTNDIIGYVIIGIVVIIIVAIIFGRSKSDTYYPVEEDEDDEVEEKKEEVKPVATKVAVKKPVAKKTTSTAKKTTKTTSTKKTAAKKNTKKK